MKTVMIICLVLTAFSVQSESKKVVVFDGPQQYWKVKPGQSLSLICHQLLASAKDSTLSCQQQLVQMNPHAFLDNNPDYLYSGQKLLLPGTSQQPGKLNPRDYHIKKFSWGEIKTLK